MAASKNELFKLFKDGELGELLVRAFDGNRICYDPFKDSNFLIIFESDAKTPNAESIGKTITQHYESIGYEVKRADSDNADVFEASVFCSTFAAPDCIFSIFLHTHWQYEAAGNKRASLRATCRIL